MSQQLTNQFEEQQEEELSEENQEENFKVDTLEELEPFIQSMNSGPNLFICVQRYDKQLHNINLSSYKCQKDQRIYFTLKQNNLVIDLMQKFQNLIQLDLKLREIKIQQQDIQELTQIIAKIKTLNDLTLNLVLNNLSGPSGTYLFESLSQWAHLKKLEIDVGATSLGDEGVIKLGKGLENLTNLINLKLGVYTNKLTNQGAAELGSSLSKILNLRTLDIDLCSNDITSLLGFANNLIQCHKLAYFFIMAYGNNDFVQINKTFIKSKSLVRFVEIYDF
ncbi:hypothetical protein ABPG74_001953 [Tetrahymena malaccensis]